MMNNTFAIARQASPLAILVLFGRALTNMTTKPLALKPLALKKGDLIGIMAPSSYVEKGDLTPGIKFLESKGFKVFIHPQTYARNNSMAGSDDEKIAALHDLLADKNIKAIIAAAGGNGSVDLLDRIDFKLVKKNPKIIMGFSDVTALLASFNARAGLVTFHGPILKWLHKIDEPDFVLKILTGKKPAYPMQSAKILNPGIAEGPMIGGNLALLHAIRGTKYMPDLKGSILFIEDIGEELSRLNRTLASLRTAGVFDNISGLIFGSFQDCKDTGKKPFGFTLEEIFRKHTMGLDIPVIMDAPFGHDDALYTMPLGSPARLTARGKKTTLTLTEPAVK